MLNGTRLLLFSAWKEGWGTAGRARNGNFCGLMITMRDERVDGHRYAHITHIYSTRVICECSVIAVWEVGEFDVSQGRAR